MIGINPVTGHPGDCMVVGRASTAIFLILSGTDLPGEQVLVPANLCYAGIYPVLYAGKKPVFCDVDPVSGNVKLECVDAAVTPRTGAMIIPHMYGNPVRDMPKIAGLCRERGIVLIEDCASAMGATAADYPLGDMGDYTVYSTGYSKTLDLGYGGLLISRAGDISAMEERERGLPDITCETEQNMAFFSRLYRLLRNEGGNLPITRMIYSGLPDCCKPGFIHGLNDARKAALLDALKALDGVVDQRRKALKCYTNALGEAAGEMLYPYEERAVPWRLNLILKDSDLRRQLIRKCLDRGLPVSDWYPRVTPMFGERGDYPGAAWHEQHILNFPLLIGEDERNRICATLTELLLRH